MADDELPGGAGGGATTERIHDPNPERYRYLADIFYRFANNKISIADIAQLPRRSLQRLAEVGHMKYQYGRLDDALEIFQTQGDIACTEGTARTAKASRSGGPTEGTSMAVGPHGTVANRALATDRCAKPSS